MQDEIYMMLQDGTVTYRTCICEVEWIYDVIGRIYEGVGRIYDVIGRTYDVIERIYDVIGRI